MCLGCYQTAELCSILRFRSQLKSLRNCKTCQPDRQTVGFDKTRKKTIIDLSLELLGELENELIRGFPGSPAVETPPSNAPSPVESREAPPTSRFPGFSEPP